MNRLIILFHIIFMMFYCYACGDENKKKSTNIKDSEQTILVVKNNISNGEAGTSSGILITPSTIKYQSSKIDFNTQKTINFEKEIENSKEDWDKLVILISIPLLKNLESQLKCDGCSVDGSGETLYVKTDKEEINITMDQDEQVSSIQELLDKVRAIRKKYTE